jgi:hypothetical protein
MDAVGNVENAGENGVYMIQADSVSAPLRIAFPETTREDEIKQTTNVLVEAAKTMELLEPFGRIQKALSSLGEE